MSKPTITTQKELRKLFWNSMREANPDKGRCYGPIASYTHNDYRADDRAAFCDFVDNMQRDGVISEALATRSTL